MSCVKLVKGSENFLGIYKGYEKFFGSDKGCEKFDRYFKNTPTGYPVLKMTGPYGRFRLASGLSGQSVEL